jgi:hypothetical protein
MQNISIIAQVAGLKSMSTQALKNKWKELHESDPPSLNRVYLESRLAYRLQELAYGGINKKTEQHLRELQEEILDNKPHANNDAYRPPVGAILVREHHGVEHRVKVLRDGFEYEGKIFKSLSSVATKIAGVKWNGPMFFGLRRKRGIV